MRKARPALRYKTLALLVSLAAAEIQAQPAEIEQIDVVGSRASLQSAIQRQRSSDKVAGVVDSDAIGNFADINVSESLRRISGVMVENDQGEGRYVSVRGMSADLNAMTINGVSTTSPEDRRGIMLDGVPTDLLDSMTVYKTLTPNLDADTIGGAIDLETISAFKYSDTFVRLKAETNYNDLTKDANNPSLSATLTKRIQLNGGELGAALVLSDQSRRIVSHNNETGGWGETAPDSDIEWRFYDLERDRQGVVLNLDYLSNNDSRLYARMFHNEYSDAEYRGKFETRDGLEDNEAVIDGDTFTYANTRVDTEARPRVEVREISSLQLGSEFTLQNGSDIRVEVFGSRAKQDDTNRVNAIYRSGRVDQPLTWDNSNPKKPVLNFADEFYDPSFYKLKSFEAEYGVTRDTDLGARFDMTLALDSGTELQYGAKLRQREKRNDFNFCAYDPLSDLSLADGGTRIEPGYFPTLQGPYPSAEGALALGALAMNQAVPALLADGTFCPSPGAGFEFSGDEEEESIPADWATDEDVMAAYLMATTEVNNMTFVYGLRYEDTRATYRGKNFVDGNYEGLSVFNKDYGFWAPSVNLKIDLSDTQVARVGLFRSLVRPGFGQSRAGAVVDVEDNRISAGNPDLDPTTAWNFDLSYELYLSDDTFFSAGLFYKQIDDAIVEIDARNVSLQGQLWDRAGTYVNADDSTIMGVEVALQKSWDNGLLASFNWTHTDGESDLPADAASGERSVPYLKQAKNTANVAFGYNKDAWDIRLAANYRSDYLDELGG
ncbi:MAG TPA: TonB-dependent receptor, partial [Pseudomonadaceae bacterium]|nr:TonB-dependent receptor [Pseudomonadaceae bacterium]